MGRPAIDLSGKQYGRWTVLSRDKEPSPTAGKHVRWLCRCQCGTERSVNSAMLIGAKSQSCGCLQSEQVTARNLKHGKYGTPVYEAWNSMRDRCYNPKHKHFKHYGGRGITICDSWDSFDVFLEDMGEPPTPLHSLDRKRTNGNYEPGNCRWVTNDVQQNNRRNNVFIELGDKCLTIAQWSRETGIQKDKIRARLRRGWPPERVLSS